MAKKIKSIVISFDTPYKVNDHDPQKWSNADVEYICQEIIKKFRKHNPIEGLYLLSSSSYYRLNFRLDYVAKDSSATIFGNTQRIREQLIMECL